MYHDRNSRIGLLRDPKYSLSKTGHSTYHSFLQTSVVYTRDNAHLRNYQNTRIFLRYYKYLLRYMSARPNIYTKVKTIGHWFDRYKHQNHRMYHVHYMIRHLPGTLFHTLDHEIFPRTRMWLFRHRNQHCIYRCRYMLYQYLKYPGKGCYTLGHSNPARTGTPVCHRTVYRLRDLNK